MTERVQGTTDRPPLVVAAEMGYGHMRPATVLAEALGVEVVACDRPPLADAEEAASWHRARRFYERLTRWSSTRVVGAPLRPVVRRMTEIAPLHPHRDQSRPNWGVKHLESAIRGGVGHGLLRALEGSGRPLLTTYFAPAIAADIAGHEDIHLVVTDSDVNRVWVPRAPAASRIQYHVPSRRALRRLCAYGVPRKRVHVTGYPLPASLTGEDLAVLERNLAARLVRLDPEGAFREIRRDELSARLGPLPEAESGKPAHLVFAVGGAGAQADLPRRFLPGLRASIERGTLRVTLVAGVRTEVEAKMQAAVRAAGLEPRLGTGIAVLRSQTLSEYFRAFDALLAETDILWTKPSELTFYGALGLALVLGSPIGTHEQYNRRWAREHGAALKQHDPRFAGQWLHAWLEDGLLAAAAWAGYLRLPKYGLPHILQHVASSGRLAGK